MKMIQVLACILKILDLVDTCITRGRFRQWARVSCMKDDELTVCVAELQRWVEAEKSLVMALAYSRVQDIGASAANIQVNTKLLGASVDEVIVNQRRDRQKTFTEAEEKRLKEHPKTERTDEIAREHATTVEKLTKGTGEWIKVDRMLQAWKDESPFVMDPRPTRTWEDNARS